MKNLKWLLLVMSFTAICSCTSETIRHVIVNNLNEPVIIEGYNFENRSISKDTTLDANQRLVIDAITSRDGNLLSDYQLSTAIDNFLVPGTDSIVFTFLNGRKFSVPNGLDFNDPLNPFNDSNWRSEEIDNNERERLFEITQAHKDAAQ